MIKGHSAKRVYPLLSLALLVFLTGCGTKKTLYHWGSYEDQLHALYTAPESIDVNTQIAELTKDVSEAESAGSNVPPGLYTHLAQLYLQSGKVSQAEQALNNEVALFPEAMRFVKSLQQDIKNLREGKESE